MESIRILLIEDNPGDARLVKEYLADYKNAVFTLEWKDTLAAGLESITHNQFDVVLLDLGLPDSPQRSVTFTRTQSTAPNMPIVVLTGLDDETFAASTVRRGAQDYLVKGKIDTETLVRTIHYAIARKLGGDKRFTIEELRQFDGADGRPAYVSFKGKVYDVSNSNMWKGGKHASMHGAGVDLTGDIARAPHGEETLARMPVLGDLVKKEALQHRLALRFESLHPHPTAVNFSLTYAPLAILFWIIWFISGQSAYETAVFILLVTGLIFISFSFATGILSWMVSYESKTTDAFNLKIALSILLFIIVLGTVIWRWTGYEKILASPASFVYLGSFVVQMALGVTLDYYGKKILYS